MDHPSADSAGPERGSEPGRRAAVPLAITLWLFGSGLLMVMATGEGADSHNASRLESDLRLAAAQAAVILFVLGPSVVAMLQLAFGKRLQGFACLALSIALGALVLSSDWAVALLGSGWS